MNSSHLTTMDILHQCYSYIGFRCEHDFKNSKISWQTKNTYSLVFVFLLVD